MTKKGWGITAIIVLAVFLFIIFAYSFVYDRLELVSEGLASPKFPFSRYSQEELNTMFPQYVNENVETTQTPEQTHAIFLSHLKTGEIDEAVECCFMKGDWKKMKEGLEKVKDQGELEIMIKDLDTEITKDLDLGNKATYTYSVERNGELLGTGIEFIKNSAGVWLIESL